VGKVNKSSNKSATADSESLVEISGHFHIKIMEMREGQMNLKQKLQARSQIGIVAGWSHQEAHREVYKMRRADYKRHRGPVERFYCVVNRLAREHEVQDLEHAG
jgi:hypothetical protein